MENQSDIELISRTLNGDPGALELLISRHYMPVYRVAYRYCGIKEDAEDIAQEVFIKLARSMSEFKGESSFTTWLYRIAVNAARDHHRSNTVKKAYEASYLEEQELLAGSSGQDNPVSAGQVYTAIDKLPAKHKDAVLLVLAEGLSHKEAAEVLNCAETTVSWRIFQARRRLKKLLKQEV